ncbi:MAG: type II toxin-antitoxin system RelE/ParE family toxin [Alphaproteobacteria bacterium]
MIARIKVLPFRTKPFTRFASCEGISDGAVCERVARAESGLVDADLGRGVIKLRLARPGQGKSGGFRSIILFRRGARAFFVFGFAKNARDNIAAAELQAFRRLADEVLGYDDASLALAMANGTMTEVMCDA